jgi:hypothetical protein
MIDDIYFEITDGPDIIKIEPLKWTHTDAELDWDKNWIHSRITVKGGAFRGQFYCDLMTTDFEFFKRELKKICDSLKGQAEFKTLEGQIQIKIEGDGLGYFSVDCEVMDEAGIGNKLNIAMAFDQTQIPDFVRQLEKIVKQFPIQGTELKVMNE